MPGSWSQEDFPHLNDQNSEVTSPTANRYNCIAWAAGENARLWWPDQMGIGYWPPGAPREETVDAFVRAYRTLGYELCYDGGLQADIEKIAIYGTRNPDGTTSPTHASLQLTSGAWTSKLGRLEDIRHKTASDVRGRAYGGIICFMSRPRHNN